MRKDFTEVSFYVVAHADDWQLFMQPNVYTDLTKTGSKVIYIITTAGDAGNDKLYWSAREEGMKSSVRFCLAPFANLDESSGTREFGCHEINWWSVSNATCYFFRLPDGNLDGNGFLNYNYSSLSRLREGSLGSISAIDGSVTYKDWGHFCTTLQQIILFESCGITNSRINYLNPDSKVNPNDHPDHVATGHAIQALTSISTSSQALFVGYNVSKNPRKLQGADLFWKAGMFAAYEKAVIDNSGYSTLREGIDTYLDWCLSNADFITVDSCSHAS